jgi:Big-like domain-containing protein
MRPTPTWSRTLLVATALAIGIEATGCGSSTAVASGITGCPDPIAGVRVEPSQLSLAAGEKAQLTVSLIPPDGATILVCPPRISWMSRDTTIAYVGDSGSVWAIRPGKTYVAALAGGKLDSALVTVAAAP